MDVTDGSSLTGKVEAQGMPPRTSRDIVQFAQPMTQVEYGFNDALCPVPKTGVRRWPSLTVCSAVLVVTARFAFVHDVIGAMGTAHRFVRASLDTAPCWKPAGDISRPGWDDGTMRLGSDVTGSGSGKK